MSSAPDQTEPNQAPQPGDAPPPGPGPWAEALRNLAALWAYSLHYLAARSDAARFRVKLALLRIAVALALAVAGLTALIVAVVLAVQGVAGGLAAALDRPWAGDLAAGFGTLLAIALLAWLAIRGWLKQSKLRTIEKYERRRTQERRTVGEDAAGRAGPTAEQP